MYKVKYALSGTSWKEVQVHTLSGVELLHIRQVMSQHGIKLTCFQNTAAPHLDAEQFAICLLGCFVPCRDINSILHYIKQDLYKVINTKGISVLCKQDTH